MATQEKRATTCGDWAYVAIATHFQKVRNKEAGVLADRDPEELHQMRVGLRRLRSALLGFTPVLDIKVSQKQVGKCGRILGKLRDMDVMTETLKTLKKGKLPQGEREILGNLCEQLSQQRAEQFSLVQAFLLSKKYRQFTQQFEQWLESPTYQAIAPVEIEILLPDLLLPQLSAFLLHPGWWIGSDRKKITQKTLDNLLTQRGDCLHDLRKVAKRSRYNRELFIDFYGEAYRQDLKKIKQVQSVIGILQDDAVLQSFLAQNVGENYGEILPELSHILRQGRFQTWKNWCAIQSQFLDPEFRLELHEILCHPNF